MLADEHADVLRQAVCWLVPKTTCHEPAKGLDEQVTAFREQPLEHRALVIAYGLEATANEPDRPGCRLHRRSRTVRASAGEPEVLRRIDTWWHELPLGEDFGADYPFFDLPDVLGSPHNSSIVAGSHAVAAGHAAANVRRCLQTGSLARTVGREDYLAA